MSPAPLLLVPLKGLQMRSLRWEDVIVLPTRHVYCPSIPGPWLCGAGQLSEQHTGPPGALPHDCFLTNSTQGKMAATTATTAMRVISSRALDRQQKDLVELGAGDVSESSAKLRLGRTLSCSPRGIPWRLMMKIWGSLARLGSTSKGS